MFRVILKAIRIVVAIALITVSLWALLLPPAFPYSAHAIVNAKAVAIKAGDRGNIVYVPTTRTMLLPSGGTIARVTRDLSKLHRDLEERNFTKLKIEGRIKNLDEANDELQRKRLLAKSELDKKRISSGKLLRQSIVEIEEKVKLYAADLIEKKADQERVKPLFDDGIVTAAQWSETRQLKIVAEKSLKAAEAELTTIKNRLESFELGDDVKGGMAAKVEAYEQESGNLDAQRMELRAELDEIKKQMEAARKYNKADSSYTLTTPIKGVVWHRYAVDGEPVTEDQVVAEIADTESLFVEAYFRRDFLNQVAIGDQATIYLLGDLRFVKGRVADIQVQEHSARVAKVINTVELDRSLLNVKIEIEGEGFESEDIGQLAKVLVSNGQPGLGERVQIWLSLLLRSHKD